MFYLHVVHMTQIADGHIDLGLNGRRPFGVGLNSLGGQLWQVTSPGLKVQPSIKWSQMGQTKRQEEDSTLQMG